MYKLFSFLLLFFVVATPVAAIYSPTEVNNNKVGVHILFPEEVNVAARLVNRNQEASWGYVVIPIQSTDRGRDRWQKFLNDCRDLKVIPIIRVATFPESSNWAEPKSHDLIDFANFLGELQWPTQNRYVVIFNEVNRADEYGGSVSPETYADILINAVTIFKERSDKFFILPAGLDNAAANTNNSIRYDTYIQRMNKARPGIFNLIDGWTSHAYPNPDFNSVPQKSGYNKVDSYEYDLKLLKKLGYKKNLPVFITETGWKNDRLPESTIGSYYKYAFENIWNDNRVVMVAPFILKAGTPPFDSFSLINKDGTYTESFTTIQKYASTGEPKLDLEQYSPQLLGARISNDLPPESSLQYKPNVFKKMIQFIFDLF